MAGAYGIKQGSLLVTQLLCLPPDITWTVRPLVGLCLFQMHGFCFAIDMCAWHKASVAVCWPALCLSSAILHIPLDELCSMLAVNLMSDLFTLLPPCAAPSLLFRPALMPVPYPNTRLIKQHSILKAVFTSFLYTG